MRNNMLRHTGVIVRGSIVVVLLLTLFAMMSLTAFAHDQTRQGFHSQTGASLQNAPSGKVDLKWNPQSKALTATLHLSGLQAGSSHAAHIHTGTCAKEGNILYPLKNIVADAAGNGTAETTINNVTGGIPATGWAVMVHSGASEKTSTILCSDVVNSTKATTVSASLSAAPAVR